MRKRLNTRRRRGPAGYEVAEKGLLLVNSAQTSVQVRTGVYSACTSTTDRQGVACVCPAGTTRSVCTNTADSQRVTCVYVAHTSKLGGRTRPVQADRGPNTLRVRDHVRKIAEAPLAPAA